MKAITLFLLSGLLLAGCYQKSKPVSESAVSGPRLIAVPQQLVPAVERTGGLKAWANTQVISGECTYTVYKDDGTKYVTTQRHGVYPWSDTIQVYANEPQGSYAWSLFKDNFRIMESPAIRSRELEPTVGNQYIIESIWSVLAPPARIAALSSEDTKPCEPVLIDGLWYREIQLPGDRSYFLNAEGIISMCLVPGEKDKFYLARGYEYRPVATTLITMPQKIEIFQSDRQAKPLKRIVEIDYFKQKTFPF
ncbi:MAG: hypothetical protein A2Y07_02255 [Planctomycetes bacterium GWF2_50_10]|nr:MAG: hypothetical protein A2Y07_02255 [Planctomycetes bacterium GWF2_50_10]